MTLIIPNLKGVCGQTSCICSRNQGLKNVNVEAFLRLSFVGGVEEG